MAAKYILAAMSLVFAIAALARVVRERGRRGEAESRLLIAEIFGTLSAWLFYAICQRHTDDLLQPEYNSMRARSCHCAPRAEGSATLGSHGRARRPRAALVRVRR